MANNGSDNSYNFPVGFNRVKSPKPYELTTNHSSMKWSKFSVPPPDNYSCMYANGQMMENTKANPPQTVHVPSHLPMIPTNNFVCRFPPPGFQNNFAYCVNSTTNGMPESFNHQFSAYAYPNPNICNQFIINNNSHSMVNRFPSTNFLTFTQQSNNALGNASQNMIFEQANMNSQAGNENDEQRAQNTSRCNSPESPITNHFDNLIQTALEGCKMAAALANSNQKRPCFKKIDTLCANLQLDLKKADNVMANINSQGLAWAVKDFIFVFTRIMNAWIIIKGYVHSQPAGLVEIQNELCPKFLDAFGRWHLATHELTQSLIESFVKLDKLAKSQRVGAGAHAKAKQSVNSMEKDKMTDECLDESSETCGFPNTDGTYIRTGLYETVKAPRRLTRSPIFGGHKIAYPLSDPDTAQPYVTVAPKSGKNDTKEFKNPPSSTVEKDHHPSSFLDRRLLEKLHGVATANAIDALLEQVCAVQEAKYFLILNFTKNYFPDFQLAAKKCSDLRSIITKAEMAAYTNIHDLIVDFQDLVDACKDYIQGHEMFELAKNDEKLAQMRTNVQKQEVAHIPIMQSFVAKMDVILREACCFVYRQEDSGTDSRTSSASSSETIVASNETFDS